MNKVRSNTPAIYRQRRNSGNDLAFVILEGMRIYLGSYGSQEATIKYGQIIAEYAAHGRAALVKGDDITIKELVAMFLQYAKGYYTANASNTGYRTLEVDNFKTAVKPLLELYAELPAKDFGPSKYEALREFIIDSDTYNWCRNTINAAMRRIRHIWRWAAAKELLSGSAYHSLQCVQPLKRGRSGATESRPVRPVSEHYIEAIREHVTPTIWAMIQVQLLSGCRPGELVAMKVGELDTSDPAVWCYRPEHHKNEWREIERIIYLGKQGIEYLRPYLAGKGFDDYLFKPAQAVAERAARSKTHRRPDQKSTRRQTERKINARYDVHTYNRAIRRGCENAGVPIWSANQLRHTAATLARRKYGVEGAAARLGHKDASTTLIYAERDQMMARRIAAEIG